METMGNRSPKRTPNSIYFTGGLIFTAGGVWSVIRPPTSRRIIPSEAFKELPNSCKAVDRMASMSFMDQTLADRFEMMRSCSARLCVSSSKRAFSSASATWVVISATKASSSGLSGPVDVSNVRLPITVSLSATGSCTDSFGSGAFGSSKVKSRIWLCGSLDHVCARYWRCRLWISLKLSCSWVNRRALCSAIDRLSAIPCSTVMSS